MRFASVSTNHVLLTWALFFVLASSAAGREWTDSTGNFKINGEVVSFDGKVVRLALDVGTAVNIPLDRLSEADQAYLKKTYPNGKMSDKGAKGGGSSDGGDSGGKTPLKTEVVGVAVYKPSTIVGVVESGELPVGTHVRLLISGGDANFIDLDTQKSKIASFVDNKNTDLLNGSAATAELLSFEALQDGKAALVTLQVTQTPAAKSVRMLLKGELHLTTGIGDSQTVRVPLNLELTLGI